MAQSSAVVAKTLATSTQYNNLRLDVLSTTLGHVHDGVNGSAYLDAGDLVFGTELDAVMRWSTGDADNHAFSLGLGDSNQAFHITDKGAIATDWNIAATTHPNVYIHSNTTPATDYLRLGGHDGTNADIDVVGGTDLRFMIAGTVEAQLDATSFDLQNNSLLNVGAAGNDWTASRLNCENSTSGGVVQVNATNTNTAAGSDALVATEVAGVGAGDPYFRMSITAGETVAFGLDNSGADDFTMSDNATLGTNDRLRLATLTGILSVDGAGAGDGLPTLFDHYDDAIELRGFQLSNVPNALITYEQQAENQRRLVEIGVAEWAIQDDDSYHWMMRVQPMFRLLAGGIWQNRQYLDELREDNRQLKALVGG